jgi:aspartate-semialdehyde dehydrogenase
MRASKVGDVPYHRLDLHNLGVIWREGRHLVRHDAAWAVYSRCEQAPVLSGEQTSIDAETHASVRVTQVVEEIGNGVSVTNVFSKKTSWM